MVYQNLDMPHNHIEDFDGAGWNIPQEVKDALRDLLGVLNSMYGVV